MKHLNCYYGLLLSKYHSNKSNYRILIQITVLSIVFIMCVVFNDTSSYTLKHYMGRLRFWSITENDYYFECFNYTHLLERFKQKRFRSARLPLPFISGNFFRLLADVIVEQNIVANFSFVDKSIIFVKSDFTDQFAAEQIRQNHTNRYILITHNSDYTAPKNSAFLLNDTNLMMWYGENTAMYHDKLTTIPLGMPYDPIYENEENVLLNVTRYSKAFSQRKRLLYANFDFGTNADRKNIFQTVCDKIGRHRVDVECTTDRISWRKFMTKLNDTKFVLSPPGNGLDCIRTWESLAMGAIPIVINTTLSQLYLDMPIVVVKNWLDVNESMLIEYEKTIVFGPNEIPYREKLWTNYWEKMILTKRDELK